MMQPGQSEKFLFTREFHIQIFWTFPGNMLFDAEKVLVSKAPCPNELS